MTRAKSDSVIRFWFDELGSENWFKSAPEIDDEIRTRFWKLHGQAVRGRLDHWMDYTYGALALIILLDQFSRNLHRGDGRAFVNDERALAHAKRSIDLGYDKQVDDVECIFFYLPFEHSEFVKDQERSLQLFEQYGNQNYVNYAVWHKEIIDRFGRFPGRNAALARVSTSEEEKYLAEGGGF